MAGLPNAEAGHYKEDGKEDTCGCAHVHACF